MSKKLSVPVGELFWVAVSGDGKDTSEKGDGTRWKKQASLYLKTDSKECRDLMAQLDEAWEEYKAKDPRIKSATEPKSLGYKVVKDKETGGETDTTSFSFSTNSFFKDGKPSNVPVYDAQGAVYDMNGEEIGNGSLGTVYGDCGEYAFKGSFGISLYLKAVQIIPSKLKLRSSDGVSAKDISQYGDETDTEGPTPISESPAI